MKKILGKCGYIHNNENGNLEYVEMISAKFKIGEYKVEYKAIVGGVKKVFVESRLDCMFESKADFEKGNARDVYNIDLYDLKNLGFVAKSEIRYGYNFLNGDTVMECTILYGYKFLNGDAVKEYAVDVEFIYDYENGKVRVANGTKYHDSREKVFEYNDYVEVDKDGNKHQVTCLANRVKMSKSRRKPLRIFKRLLRTALRTTSHYFST